MDKGSVWVEVEAEECEVDFSVWGSTCCCLFLQLLVLRFTGMKFLSSMNVDLSSLLPEIRRNVFIYKFFWNSVKREDKRRRKEENTANQDKDSEMRASQRMLLLLVLVIKLVIKYKCS